MADILDKRPVDDEMTVFETNVNPYKLNACIDNILMQLDKLETKFTDVQSVNTREILRHLDSLMNCITNAYNSSLGLLRSDMIFMEKQATRIRELLIGSED